ADLVKPSSVISLQGKKPLTLAEINKIGKKIITGIDPVINNLCIKNDWDIYKKDNIYYISKENYNEFLEQRRALLESKIYKKNIKTFSSKDRLEEYSSKRDLYLINNPVVNIIGSDYYYDKENRKYIYYEIYLEHLPGMEGWLKSQGIDYKKPLNSEIRISPEDAHRYNKKIIAGEYSSHIRAVWQIDPLNLEEVINNLREEEDYLSLLKERQILIEAELDIKEFNDSITNIEKKLRVMIADKIALKGGENIFKGKHKQAFENYLTAAEMYKNLGLKRLSAKYFEMCGYVYSSKDVKKAFEGYREAYNLRYELNDFKKAAFDLIMMGDFSYILKNMDESAYFYETAAEIYEKQLNDPNDAHYYYYEARERWKEVYEDGLWSGNKERRDKAQEKINYLDENVIEMEMELKEQWMEERRKEIQQAVEQGTSVKLNIVPDILRNTDLKTTIPVDKPEKIDEFLRNRGIDKESKIREIIRILNQNPIIDEEGVYHVSPENFNFIEHLAGINLTDEEVYFGLGLPYAGWKWLERNLSSLWERIKRVNLKIFGGEKNKKMDYIKNTADAEKVLLKLNQKLTSTNIRKVDYLIERGLKPEHITEQNRDAMMYMIENFNTVKDNYEYFKNISKIYFPNHVSLLLLNLSEEQKMYINNIVEKRENISPYIIADSLVQKAEKYKQGLKHEEGAEYFKLGAIIYEALGKTRLAKRYYLNGLFEYREVAKIYNNRNEFIAAGNEYFKAAELRMKWHKLNFKDILERGRDPKDMPIVTKIVEFNFAIKSYGLEADYKRIAECYEELVRFYDELKEINSFFDLYRVYFREELEKALYYYSMERNIEVSGYENEIYVEKLDNKIRKIEDMLIKDWIRRRKEGMNNFLSREGKEVSKYPFNIWPVQRWNDIRKRVFIEDEGIEIEEYLKMIGIEVEEDIERIKEKLDRYRISGEAQLKRNIYYLSESALRDMILEIDKLIEGKLESGDVYFGCGLPFIGLNEITSFIEDVKRKIRPPGGGAVAPGKKIIINNLKGFAKIAVFTRWMTESVINWTVSQIHLPLSYIISKKKEINFYNSYVYSDTNTGLYSIMLILKGVFYKVFAIKQAISDKNIAAPFLHGVNSLLGAA
ncbi:MAG: hypothetical protein ACOC56_01985, partial [Atribacterota bacterium]